MPGSPLSESKHGVARGNGTTPAQVSLRIGKDGVVVMGGNAVLFQRRESSRVGCAAFMGAPRKRTVVFQGQVLLIENLRARQQLMRDMLTQERLEVGVVEDAWDAAQLLSWSCFAGQGSAPEFVICNARILDDAGFEALERLWAYNPDVSVILYTPFASPKLREKMARIEGACVLDPSSDLEDLRVAALSMTTVTARRMSI